MRCPTCVDQDRTSRVYPRGASKTLMYFSPYYDEEGEYHHHDNNTVTESFRCSNGHEWTAERRDPCPNPKCTWPN